MHFCGGSRARIAWTGGFGKKPVAVRADDAHEPDSLPQKKQKTFARGESGISTTARGLAFLQALDVRDHTSRVRG
jgi:hypothetical protein